MKITIIKLGKFFFTMTFMWLLAVSVFTQPPSPAPPPDPLDFDGDEKDDFSVFRRSNNTWYSLKSSNIAQSINQSFNTNNPGFVLSKQDYFTPGDYDGDNKADFSIWRNSDGNWIQYRSNNGYSLLITQFGVSGDQPVAGDYDGDGKTDFAVIRRTYLQSPQPVPPAPCPQNANCDGVMTWYILKSTNNQMIVEQFGFATDYAAPGDYDGDGKHDIAIQRPARTIDPVDNPSIFVIKQSINNAVRIENFSMGNELVVPGDYDGDGKTDLAVVRQGWFSSANLLWTIVKSTGGPNQIYSVNFGLTVPDKMVQGDYTGDGITDIAVWRQTDRNFYILNVTNGATSAAQYGIVGDFPIATYNTH